MHASQDPQASHVFNYHFMCFLPAARKFGHTVSLSHKMKYGRSGQRHLLRVPDNLRERSEDTFDSKRMFMASDAGLDPSQCDNKVIGVHGITAREPAWCQAKQKFRQEQ